MKTSTANIKKLKIAPRRRLYNLFVGNFQSVFKSQGIEFDDIREYIPGDSVKDISWKTFSKTNKLYIKQYTETKELKVHFIVDTSSSMRWQIDPENSKADIVRNLIYLIGYTTIQNNDEIAATFFKQGRIHSIRPGKGKKQLLQLLKEFNKEIKTDLFVESDVKGTLKLLLNNSFKKSVCFLITDDINSSNPHILKLLKAVNHKHELIIIQVNDIYETNPELLTALDSIQDVETGEIINIELSKKEAKKAREEFSQNLEYTYNNLHKANIGYINLSPDTDILVPLIKYFRLRHKINDRYS